MIMEQKDWVKLFRVNGTQVIVTIEADDDDSSGEQYIIKSKTIIDDTAIEMPITLKSENSARRLFEKADEDFASLVVKQYYKLIAENK